MRHFLTLASILGATTTPIYKNPFVIAAAVLLIALVILVVALFLSRNSGKKKNAANPANANDWQRQQVGGQPGQQQGWGQQQAGGWGMPAQPPQQPAWGAPAQQQPGGWDAAAQQPPQQNSWGGQQGVSGGAPSWDQTALPSSQDAWGQQPGAPAWGAQNNAQQAPAAFGANTPDQWGQSAPAADPWAQAAPQQMPQGAQSAWPGNAAQQPSATPPVGTPPVPSWQQQQAPGFGQGQQQDWGTPTAPQQPRGWDANVAKQQTLAQVIPASSQRQKEDAVVSPKEIDIHYSDVSFPSHTAIGRQEGLRVAITRRALNSQAVPLMLELPLDRKQPIMIDVYVDVSPLDFDIEGSHFRTITVFPDADSPPILFKLTAKSMGQKTIAVEFFQDTRYLGRATLETSVNQLIPLPTMISARLLLEAATTLSPPDLTILFDRVTVSDSKHYYRYRLLSPLRELDLFFDEFHSPETSVTPQGILEETFAQLDLLLRNPPSNAFFFGRLNSMGMSLYRRLFSDDFKRFYWNRLREKVKNIVIISYEPWIPWEIVRPFNIDTNEAEDGFLCEKFNLTRWLAGAGFPDTLSLEHLGLIVSSSSLDAAKLEADEIKRLLGVKVREIHSSNEAVYQMLRTDDLSGLHFACHGSYNKENPDTSKLFLEDETWLSPIDVDGDGLTFGRKRPLVFLNACETGKDGYALTGMGGWAEAFVGRAKCSGFIGSIWKANDESACKFAASFYNNLLEGKSISEAVRLARQDIKQAGDPTWLSYTVYANPLAHLAQ